MLLAHFPLLPAYSASGLKNRESIRRYLRRTVAASIAAMAASSPVLAASALPLDPSGLWSTKDDESIIRIAPCTIPPSAAQPGGAVPAPAAPSPAVSGSAPYCGTLVWLKDPLDKGMPKTDIENPDKDKRGRPLIGLELLSELAAEKDHWKGKAYNADDGKTYDITFKVVPDKVNGDKGEITGCVLRILCMSETFTKVQAVPGGDPTLPSAAAPHGTPVKTSVPARTH